MSRRRLLKQSAAMPLIWLATPALQAQDSHAGSRDYVYVGGAYNSDPAMNGIATFARDGSTGSLSPVHATAAPNNPSFLALDRSGRFLYAGNEAFNANGAVTAYRANSDGSLTFIDSAPNSIPPGFGPAHISVHPSGKYLLTASWGGASFSVLPLLGNGGVGDPVESIIHTGNLGPNQKQAHPHMFEADPSGKFVLLQDLGQDRTYIFVLDLETGKLSAGPTPFVQARAGSGPRHFAFHPNGGIMYSINEVGSSIDVYHWTPSKGSLILDATVSTLPAGYRGLNKGSEIAVSRMASFSTRPIAALTASSVFYLLPAARSRRERSQLGHGLKVKRRGSSPCPPMAGFSMPEIPERTILPSSGSTAPLARSLPPAIQFPWQAPLVF